MATVKINAVKQRARLTCFIYNILLFKDSFLDFGAFILIEGAEE